ncbi:MAG: hypothetical protein Q9183_006222, partial [Haloplaca sp. 2 TL-2023]
MDPLSALGLVANIIQVVDAGANAYRICHEIYERGAAIEDSRMLYTTEQLFQSYVVLKGPLTGGTSSGHCVTQSGVDLKDLASKCCDTAKILETELTSLMKSPGGGKLAAVSKGLLRMRKAKKLEKLNNALNEYQKTLDSKLIIQIMSSLGDINVQQQGQTHIVQQHLTQLSA